MSTLVCFHAHPDDECITTAGLMADAKERGHRVVLVVATRGELGEVPDGFLPDGEELWERRTSETFAAADLIGVDRVEFLGYIDSGMAGEPENDAPGSFWGADVGEAAARLAAILDEERPEVFVIYDDHGYYWHPDHIQVHRVGVAASELVEIPTVVQATLNRDLLAASAEARAADSDADGPSEVDALTWGLPAAEITHGVDVARFAPLKRQAMRAHASQIAEDSWFLAMDDETFQLAFGTEWYADLRHTRGQDEPFRTTVW